MKFLGVDGIEIVNLAHTWAPGKICHYPGDPEYQLREVATIDDDGYALNYVSVGEHTGTHWGAPAISTPARPPRRTSTPKTFSCQRSRSTSSARRPTTPTTPSASTTCRHGSPSTARSRTSAPSYSTPAGTSGGPPSSTPTSTTTASPATRILAGRGAVVTRRRRAGPARGAGHRCFQSRRRRR